MLIHALRTSCVGHGLSLKNGGNRPILYDRLEGWSQLIDVTLYYSPTRERSVDYKTKDTDKLLSVPAGVDVGSLATWELTEVDWPPV